MMTWTAITILSLVLSTGSGFGENCNCVSVPGDETTQWGLHANIVIDQVERVNSFRGVVTKGNPLSETLVEVFSDGEIVAMDNSPEVTLRKENQIRVAACTTGEDGEFCFDHLAAGTYELRLSKKGWETISLIINFDPSDKSRTGKKIEVDMPIH